MGKGKDYTTTELNEIRDFIINDKLSYSEVAELTDRTPKAIANVAQRNGWLKRKPRKHREKVEAPVYNGIVAEPSLLFDSGQNEPVVEIEEVTVEQNSNMENLTNSSKCEKTLDDFSPDEIVEYLFTVLGAVINDNKIVYYTRVRHEFDPNNVSKNG